MIPGAQLHNLGDTTAALAAAAAASSGAGAGAGAGSVDGAASGAGAVAGGKKEAGKKEPPAHRGSVMQRVTGTSATEEEEEAEP